MITRSLISLSGLAYRNNEIVLVIINYEIIIVLNNAIIRSEMRQEREKKTRKEGGKEKGRGKREGKRDNNIQEPRVGTSLV